MTRFFINPKFVTALFVLALVLITATHEAGSALIDWTKHEEWRRKQLEAIVQEVKRKGSTPYVVMSFREYDLDKNGEIDERESEAIEAYLKKLAAAQPQKRKFIN